MAEFSDPPTSLELDAAIALETARLASDRNDAVCMLRELEEDRARGLLGIGPALDGLVPGASERVRAGLEPTLAQEAWAHLVNAERWQREIGSWSTGSGEGLMSMEKVYTLKLAQAWLLACAGDLPRARELAREIEFAPNRLGRHFTRELHEFHAFTKA